MQRGRPTRNLIYLMLLLLSAPGCQAFHAYRPVPIEVRDAETKEPIAGVDVRISYPLTNPSLAPAESSATTGPDGIARLRAAPYGDAGTQIEVSAKGYMADYRYVTNQELQALESAHWFEDVQKRPVALVMEMYTEPRPTVELIVPTYFRGLIKATVKIQADARIQPGQRRFTYEVPMSGEVLVAGHPMLRRVTPLNYEAKLMDGTPLKQASDVLTIGLRWLKCEGNVQYFVIGNKRDYDEIRFQLQKDGAAANRSSDNGNGRRGRKGNPPASDFGPVGAVP